MDKQFPGYNLIFLYACDVLSGSSPYPVQSGFDLQSQNAAVLGFVLPTTILVYTPFQWQATLENGLPSSNAQDPPIQLTPTMSVGDYFERIFSIAWNGPNPTGNDFDNRYNSVVNSINSEMIPVGMVEYNANPDKILWGRSYLVRSGDANGRLKGVFIDPSEFSSLNLTTADLARWWLHLSP